METFRRHVFQNVSEGLGQLEAYIGAEEGVAFQMDNNLFWDSLGRGYGWGIQGVFEKMESGKFWITLLPSGKVMLRDWIGMYLAVGDVGTDPDTFPIQTVNYREDVSLQFEVFYRGNRVAFRAYNGLFLARMYRDFHTIEAAKLFADDMCYFRPLIGDIILPVFELLRLEIEDFSKVRCQRHVLEKQTFINRSNVPEGHTFTMTWETHCVDRIIWDSLWGLGLPFSWSFMVEDASPILKYTEDNKKVITQTRYIYVRKREVVEVPAKAKAIASLLVYWHKMAAVPFAAVIEKVKSNGVVETLRKTGAWQGLAYRDVHIKIKIEKLDGSCTAM